MFIKPLARIGSWDKGAGVLEDVDFLFPDFEAGWVWLVGAGPGDPGLLTLHAVNGLRQADVVVYDALVDPRILDLARPDAQRVFAGKRGGRPSPKQADISERLVAFAKQGLKVLRLKGGDPFVFGRGGEESLALVGASIPFRVVPGITAGIAGPAYAGIPATHRDLNSSVTFVTGHGASGALPEGLDWQALARGARVLIFYMVMRQLPRVSAQLIAHGRAADEPVALISRATTREQKVVETTLERCAEDAKTLSPPAIAVIGPVVSLRRQLKWLSPTDIINYVI